MSINKNTGIRVGSGYVKSKYQKGSLTYENLIESKMLGVGIFEKY